MPDIMMLPELCKILGISCDELLELPKVMNNENYIGVNTNGMNFELTGYDYMKSCMKLCYEDVAKYLSILTDEKTYKVLQAVPFIEDDFVTPSEICKVTSLSETDVLKALRTLEKRGLIEDASEKLEEGGMISPDNSEPKYWQETGGMIGIYMVLAGCSGSCRSIDEASGESIEKETETNITRITNSDGSHTTTTTTTKTSVSVSE